MIKAMEANDLSEPQQNQDFKNTKIEDIDFGGIKFCK